MVQGTRPIDKETKTRTKPMKVLVMGMPRTGTMSMYTALRQLGYNCYHMFEAVKNASRDLNLWSDAVEAKFFKKGKPFGREEFNKLFGDYDATCDVPSIMFVDELTAAYPDAKVILTNRDVDKWLVSFRNTGTAVVMGWPSWFILQFLDDVFVGPWFRFAMLLLRVWGASPEKLRQVYLDHYAHVREVVPKENLLEFDPSMGWGPLCEFLGCEVPEGEYPRVNDTGNFVKLHEELWWEAVGRSMKKIAKVLVPAAAVGVALYLSKTVL